MSTKSDVISRPGTSKGLFGVFRYRYLLKLLVKKEVRIRYRGSWLGMVWTYIKPLTQFLVFYVAMGIFMGMGRSGNLQVYPVYLFSAVIVTNFFTEAFGNCTRSILSNTGLIQKIYLPRELFPLASLRVAFVHFFPQLVILLLGAAITGWRPDIKGLIIAIIGFAALCCFAFGLGLFFGSINVFYRDAENITDLVAMIAPWAAPCFYPWTMVAAHVPRWLLELYFANPIAVCVESFHRGFWWGATDEAFQFSGSWVMRLGVSLLVSLFCLVVGELTFKHLEGRFAQEL
ncbi:ABC transporter permease [Bifidobacterium sp. ESL0790]|uniref:ABC transporter permease n=1 Tax=Bifidobacterium sp. ESL0790 TaxID=2983233 RepID=UPI0023F74057|nr:ABC transporter permease [Bifidobacterium sp. ESL0790]WEV72341.1 ABC transporter permease [Bifidobacterium sp. ESL0790]